MFDRRIVPIMLMSVSLGSAFYEPHLLPFIVPAVHVHQSNAPSILANPLLLSDSADLGFQAPPATTLFGLTLTVALSTGAYVYWDGTIVPQKRKELAKSKRKGEIKEYLDDLKEADERSAEKWLMNDWLENEPGKEKQPAVPFLPSKKFNSGDNPVIATTALIMLPVLLAAALHR